MTTHSSLPSRKCECAAGKPLADHCLIREIVSALPEAPSPATAPAKRILAPLYEAALLPLRLLAF